MIGKIIKYSLMTMVVLFAGTLIFSEETRTDLKNIWYTFTKNQVGRLESKVNQGELALMRYDEAKRKAEQRLITITRLQKDLQMKAARTKELIEDYRSQGKEDLIARNEEQLNFIQNQQEMYKQSEERIRASLGRVKTVRTRAREDIRLARDRIAILNTAKEALDNQDMEQLLAKAEQNVSSLQSQCSKLEAEVEVLNMEE